MKLIVLIFTLLILLVSFQTSFACSCVQRSTCEFASTASVAFIGKVIDSEELSRKVVHRELPMGGDWESRESVEGRQVSRLSIQESFFGTQGKDEIVIETETSSSCGFRLQAGETYLIYADKSDNEVNLMTHMCSGSKLLSRAGEDLAYLRPNKNNAASLSGNVGFGTWWKLDSSRLARYGVNTVRLTGGDKLLDAEIGSDGSYSFIGLAPGNYNVGVVLPDSLTQVEKYNPDIADELEIGDQSQIKIGEHGCVKEDFLIRENGRISGRLIDEKGASIEDVTVHLIPIDSKGHRIPQEDECYDNGLCLDAREDGRFFFKGLKAGRYLIGVRMGDYVCNDCVDAEFKKALYPGVADERGAKAVTVRSGEATSDITFKLTRRYASEELTGRVYFKDGRPAANVKVRYVTRTPDLKDNAITVIKTDAEGRFSFTAYESHVYLVGAFTDKRDNREEAEANALTVRIQPGKKPQSIKLVLDQIDGSGDFSDFPKKALPKLQD